MKIEGRNTLLQLRHELCKNMQVILAKATVVLNTLRDFFQDSFSRINLCGEKVSVLYNLFT